jgi:invasion protein IalB
MRDQRSLGGGCRRWLVLATTASMLLAGPSISMIHAGDAATSNSIAANDQLPAAEVGPRGHRATREIKYGDWNKFCFRAAGARPVCRTTISGTWETGQTAVRIDLIEREGDGTVRLQIFLPVGLYLQAGVKVTVDQGDAYFIPYSWCMTNMCIAGQLADPKLVRELEAGLMLVVEVVDTNVLTITTSLSLNRFAAVRKGAPTQVFEQTNDE